MSQAPTKPPEPEDRAEVLEDLGGENVDEQLERGEEKHEAAEAERQEQKQEQLESAADGQAIEDWLTQETTRDVDTISFRGREFEFSQPGVIHRRQTMKILSESDPETFEDVDPDDDEAVNETIEENLDPESIKNVVGLYDHQLETITELCTDPVMGDETVPEGDDLSRGAQRWGRFKLEDETDADGNVIKEGLSTLSQQVVAERLEATDEGEGN
ncbi:hypothetical protein HTZ84_05200 [Haloterrigena sp. SYSU A558-1]|uniref:Uncharacterized protein n=1 Tax=Haloterrigena gelatinilytica TaxID=2741724 RepID=A0ABX2L622_9EURY|nr:hypothetical protein [Haloterrigena gelatinilytica]NUC71710.1 hypothetical protein [Haloterrigena gelatinilytica]